jgi:hypothetical protein
MTKLLDIRPRASSGKPARKAPPTKRPTLADAPGVVVNGGLTIEWAATNAGADLTAAELENVRKRTGLKSLNAAKVLRIKTLMRTKTCAQIVQHFAGRKGYCERTIRRYHAALSDTGVGVE